MTAHHTMLQFIATGDRKLMRKVNKWLAPKWVRHFSMLATRAGDGWLWYLTGIFVVVFGASDRFIATAAAGSAALVGIGLF
jgi:undecaprenyl-diphosphatase